MATKTPPTVSSFLWGYEAPALMLNVLRDARDLGFAKGFKARFKRNLEKHGETHGARSPFS
ncbi:MAG TPA: hypothetical protein VMQ56_06125, partial [Terracidiphilus sp.]|nr:hypothetical protein [Terracidiphilus sp.]